MPRMTERIATPFQEITSLSFPVRALFRSAVPSLFITKHGAHTPRTSHLPIRSLPGKLSGSFGEGCPRPIHWNDSTPWNVSSTARAMLKICSTRTRRRWKRGWKGGLGLFGRPVQPGPVSHRERCRRRGSCPGDLCPCPPGDRPVHSGNEPQGLALQDPSEQFLQPIPSAATQSDRGRPGHRGSARERRRVRDLGRITTWNWASYEISWPGT